MINLKTKRLIILFLTALLIVSFLTAVVACKPDPTPPGPGVDPKPQPGGDTWTVKFESVGGTAVESKIVKNGEKISPPTDPTKAGAKFLGWYLAATGNDRYNFAAPVTGNLTLYAHWSDDTFSVQFDVNGGSPIVPFQTKTYKQQVSAPTTPTRVGYEFNGWYTDVACTNKATFPYEVESNVNFYAGWTSTTDLTLNFKMAIFNGEINGVDYEQEILAPKTVRAGTKIEQPENPKDVTYVDAKNVTHTLKFAYWDSYPVTHSSFTRPILFPIATADNQRELTLYAVYIEVNDSDVYASLTVHPENGEKETVMYGIQGKRVAIANLNANSLYPFYSNQSAPLRAGYEATGYYKTQDFTASHVYEVPFLLENVTNDVYIRWEKKDDVSLTLANHGSVKAEYRGLIARPENPFKEGYTFDGWYKTTTTNVSESNRFDFAYDTLTYNATIFPKWIKTATVVTFDTKGGYERNPIAIESGSVISFLPTPVRQSKNTAYNFLGWYRDDGCTQEVQLPFTITEDITLYAKWSDAVDLSKIQFNYIGTGYSVSAKSSQKNNIVGKIIIPSLYAGLPVKRIESGGFKDCQNIEEVELPDSVVYLYDSAFSGCVSLKKVTLSDSTVQISLNAFEGCKDLAEVNYPANGTLMSIYADIFGDCPSMWDSFTTDSYGMYYWGKALLGNTYRVKGEQSTDNTTATLTVKNGTQVIANYALYNMTALQTLTFADSVEYATQKALPGDNGSLKTLNLSKSFDDYTRLTTYYPKTLETITVPETNTKMKVENGCLIYVPEKKLVASTVSADTIPDGVEIIGEYSFRFKNLETVLIPSSVTTIRTYAFEGCSFTRMNIPDNVGVLDSDAFKDCKNMEEITFGVQTQRLNANLFRSMSKLRSLTVSAKNTAMRTQDNVLYDKNSLEIIYVARGYHGKITILDGVTYLPDQFGSSYTEFIIPDSVTDIEKGIFDDFNGNIGKLVIGKNIKEVGAEYLSQSFDIGYSIESIELSKENPYMTEVDGLIYSKDLTKLLYAPVSLTSLDIPDTVTYIDYGIFLPNLQSLRVGAKLPKYQLMKMLYGDYLEEDEGENYRELTFRLIAANISVSEDNAEMTVFSGCVYSKDKTELIYIPSGYQGNFVIPKEISDFNFNVIDYTSLYLPYDSYQSRTVNGLTLNTVSAEENSQLMCIGNYALSASLNMYDSERAPWTANYPYYFDGRVGLSINTVDLSNCAKLTELKEQAISNHRSVLTTIRLPSSVTTIGALVFAGDSTLEELDADLTNASIGNMVFYGCNLLFDENGYLIVNNVLLGISDSASGASSNKDYVIPDTVTVIKSQVFANTTARSITIPNSVTAIEKQAITLALYGQGVLAIYVEAAEIPQGFDSEWYTLNEGNADYTVDLILDCKNADVKYYTDETTGLYYQLNAENSTCVLLNAAYGKADVLTGEYSLPSEITVKGKTYTVTAIGAGAFNRLNDNQTITTLIIPDTVVSIGTQAFAGMSALQHVIIPDSVRTLGSNLFESCSALQTAQLGAGITVIPEGMFKSCKSLTTVAASATITSIGERAFYYCEALSSLFDLKEVTAVGNSAFNTCKALIEARFFDKLEALGDSAFSGCSALSSVDLGNKITKINVSTFRNCAKLTVLVIPSSVTEIGANVLSGCKSLQTLSVPFVGQNADGTGNVKFNYLFNGSNPPSSLTTVNITTDTILGEQAFYKCNNIVTINAQTINGIGKNCCYKMTNLATFNAVINGIVGDQAFYGCDKLTSEINFGKEIKSIGTYSFSATKIASVKFNGGTFSIGNYAFMNDSQLAAVVFDESCIIESIGDMAFKGIAATEITLPQIKTMNAFIFMGCADLTVTVPFAENEIPSEWSSFWNGDAKVLYNTV